MISGALSRVIVALLVRLANAAAFTEAALTAAAGWLARVAALRAEPDPRVVAHARAHISGRPSLRVAGATAHGGR